MSFEEIAKKITLDFWRSDLALEAFVGVVGGSAVAEVQSVPLDADAAVLTLQRSFASGVAGILAGVPAVAIGTLAGVLVGPIHANLVALAG